MQRIGGGKEVADRRREGGRGTGTESTEKHEAAHAADEPAEQDDQVPGVLRRLDEYRRIERAERGALEVTEERDPEARVGFQRGTAPSAYASCTTRPIGSGPTSRIPVEKRALPGLAVGIFSAPPAALPRRGPRGEGGIREDDLRVHGAEDGGENRRDQKRLGEPAFRPRARTRRATAATIVTREWMTAGRS